MGLAPIVVDEIFEALELLATRGISLVVVEQYISQVLKLAEKVVILNHGRTTYDGPPSGLDRAEILSSYLGDQDVESEEHV
jgi:branched-chain amino acid transport system ATP-binding protein